MNIIAIILEIFGSILGEFLKAYHEGPAKDYLEQVLPVAERWVKALETTTLKGQDKRSGAFAQIVEQLSEQGIPIIESKINTAIELAVDKLQAELAG